MSIVPKSCSTCLSMICTCHLPRMTPLKSVEIRLSEALTDGPNLICSYSMSDDIYLNSEGLVFLGVMNDDKGQERHIFMLPQPTEVKAQIIRDSCINADLWAEGLEQEPTEDQVLAHLHDLILVGGAK